MNGPSDRKFRRISPGRGDIPGMWEYFDGKEWRAVTDEDLRRMLDWNRKEQGDGPKTD